MPDHYDTLETRDPATRERELFARLPEAVAHAMAAPGWAKQLAGHPAKSLTARSAGGTPFMPVTSVCLLAASTACMAPSATSSFAV